MPEQLQFYLTTLCGPRRRMERGLCTYTRAGLTEEYEAFRDGYFLKRLKCNINGLDTGLVLEKET